MVQFSGKVSWSLKKKVMEMAVKSMVIRTLKYISCILPADISDFIKFIVIIRRIIVIISISNEILKWKVIPAREKIMEAEDCLVEFFQETRADPGKASTIQLSMSDFLRGLYG